MVYNLLKVCQYCGLATDRDTFCCLDCASAFILAHSKVDRTIHHEARLALLYREADYV